MLTLTRRIKEDFKEPRLKTWAGHFDRMMRLDGRTPTQIEAVLRWVLNDPFWQSNVLSPRKLRERFDQLEICMRRSRAAKGDSEGNKNCLVCRAAGKHFQVDKTGTKRVWLCGPCYDAFRQSGGTNFGMMSPNNLEQAILEQKAART
jgi:hypothetical protein